MVQEEISILSFAVKGKSLWNFETIFSPPVFFLLTVPKQFYILSSLCLAVLWPPDGKGMISCLSYVWCFFFLSLSHSMSWIRCGTGLYRFLIFAFFLTLVEGIIRNILWNYFYFIGIILNFHISDLEHFLGCTFMTRFVQPSSYIHINVLNRFLPSHFFQ